MVLSRENPPVSAHISVWIDHLESHHHTKQVLEVLGALKVPFCQYPNILKNPLLFPLVRYSH